VALRVALTVRQSDHHGTTRLCACSYSEHCGVDFTHGLLSSTARFGGQEPHAFVPDDSETEGASGLVAAA
jgi:hypothetical protein